MVQMKDIVRMCIGSDAAVRLYSAMHFALPVLLAN